MGSMHGLPMRIAPAPAAVAPSLVVLRTWFWFHASVLVPFFTFGSGFQFWSRVSVLAVAFGFGPLFQFWPLFEFAVRWASRGAPGPSCGLRRRVWPGASGSTMGAGLLSIPWGSCGVLGLLSSSLGWWACSVLV